MMNRQPSQGEIDEAKKFVLARLAIQRTIVSLVHQIVVSLVDKAVKYAFANNITPYKILKRGGAKYKHYLNRIVASALKALKPQIANYIYNDCSDEDIEVLEPIVFGTIVALTFDERIDIYIQRLVEEMQNIIAAEIFLEKTQDETIKEIEDNLTHPYQSETIRAAMSKGLPIVVPAYGRGISNSMLTAITTLASFTVARGIMEKYYRIDNKDADGWYVMRGSSYPCEKCDNEVGWHPDTSDLPPYHPNCCCVAIPLSDLI